MRHGSPEAGAQHVGTGTEFAGPTAEGGTRRRTWDESGYEAGIGRPTGIRAGDEPRIEDGAGVGEEAGIEDRAECPNGIRAGDEPGIDDEAGIGDVDWGALRHAYGSAEDVPALLRAAGGAADPAEREEAFDELGSALCHQGSVYSATVAAVPFLARLAQAPGTDTRDRLRCLWWLLAAADGSGREHGEVRRAVAMALPGLLGLAADEDRDVRRALVWLITACGEASLPLLPLLRARLAEEPDADVRADLVTALGLLDVPPADGPSAAEARNLALLAGAPEPAVRRAAATELLRTAPLPCPRPWWRPRSTRTRPPPARTNRTPGPPPTGPSPSGCSTTRTPPCARSRAGCRWPGSSRRPGGTASTTSCRTWRPRQPRQPRPVTPPACAGWPGSPRPCHGTRNPTAGRRGRRQGRAGRASPSSVRPSPGWGRSSPPRIRRCGSERRWWRYGSGCPGLWRS
ncbi:HEAT repeat domain-containing protein [Streptomyces sp. SBR177]